MYIYMQRRPAVIAVVDDDERILESLDSLLASAGYAVQLYSVAEDVLKARPFLAFDCLVSDIKMPGMNGLELIKTVRRERPDLPVILITGLQDEETLKSISGLGLKRVFRKPVDPSNLLEAVEKALAPR